MDFKSFFCFAFGLGFLVISYFFSDMDKDELLTVSIISGVICVMGAFFLWAAKTDEKEAQEAERKKNEEKLAKQREEERKKKLEQQKLEEEKRNKLEVEKRIIQTTTVPIENGSIRTEDVQFANEMLDVIDRCNEKQSNLLFLISNGVSLTPEEKAQKRDTIFHAADASLCLLYGVSLRTQCEKLGVPYEPYHSALESAINKSNSLPMRTDDDELDILNHIPTHQLRELEELSRFAIDNNIHSYLDELEQISQRDTSGFLGESLELVEAKTSDMNIVVNKIYSDVESVKQWCININQVLNVARVEAFRNQYLGFELFNIISRESEGSENMIEQSTINIDQLDIPNLSFSIEDFKLSLGDVAGKFIEVMGAMSELNIKSGKGQAAVAVAGAAMALVAARNEKIEQNLSQQNAYHEYAQNVLPKLTSTIAQRKQAIDIIRLIVANNDAFMSVYVPLRNEIFVEKKAPKQIENCAERLSVLKSAVNQYYQISNKKI